MDRAEILLRTPLFRGLPPAELAELLPHLGERRFARGEAVWLEGDPADTLHVVASGQVKSYRVSVDGAEVILGFNGVGDITGHVGLFHPLRARLVNVEAMEPTVCLTLRREPLLAFLRQHPPVMERMLELISDVAGRAAYSFSGLAFEDIRRRVVRALLALAEEFGEPAGHGIRIRLRLSQRTLAALVAASRENVNRALHGLVVAGVVTHHDGYFHVHDLDVLRGELGGL